MRVFRRFVGAIVVLAVVCSVPRVVVLAQAPTDAARISVADLKKLIAEDTVVVLDVRSKSSYESGHIAGALLVPEDTVALRASEWKDSKKAIVTYCS